MPRLMIDRRLVETPPGSTILQAALSVGIRIPTLCFREGLPHNPACLVCIVKENRSGRLLPACGSLAEEGMSIDTQSDEVYQARRSALQLLVNDHRGNCTAACQRSCPAGLDIPRMLHLVREEHFPEAVVLAQNSLVFPGILGRICPAYCEKGCQAWAFHAQLPDSPVAIRELHRFLAEPEVSSGSFALPAKKAATGKKIAIVGAGPAGLATAFYLLREGHSCHLFEQQEKPGGSFYEINDQLLPGRIVERETEVIGRLGAEFSGGVRVGKDLSLNELQADYDAVALTFGGVDTAILDTCGITYSEKGVQVNPNTLATNVPGIYAGGAMIRSGGRATVKSIADARLISASITRSFKNNPEFIRTKPFQSRVKITAANPLAENNHIPASQNSKLEVTNQNSAVREAARCRQCGCLKAENCRLRDYATEYQIRQNYWGSGDSSAPADTITGYFRIDHGKCIRCGICVRISEKAGIRAGFTFMGRGYEMYIGVPFDLEPDEDFQRIIPDCIAHCPTGALSNEIKKKPFLTANERE